MSYLTALQSHNVFVAKTDIVCLGCGHICDVAFPVFDAGFTERQRIDGLNLDVALPFVGLISNIQQIMPDELYVALRANSSRFALTTRGYRHLCPLCCEFHDEKRILSPYGDGTLNEHNIGNIIVHSCMCVLDDALVIGSYDEANWLHGKLLEAS